MNGKRYGRYVSSFVQEQVGETQVAIQSANGVTHVIEFRSKWGRVSKKNSHF